MPLLSVDAGLSITLLGKKELLNLIPGSYYAGVFSIRGISTEVEVGYLCHLHRALLYYAGVFSIRSISAEVEVGYLCHLQTGAKVSVCLQPAPT